MARHSLSPLRSPFVKPFEGGPVVAEFDGGALTADAGGLLFSAADRRLGLVGRLAGCFHDAGHPRPIAHSVATLIGQRIFGIAFGYEDLNDHDELRHDPPIPVLAGKHSAAQRLRARSRQVDAQPPRTVARHRHAPSQDRPRPGGDRGPVRRPQGEANPRFIVTSLSQAEANGRFLYEKVYCARGDMKNRIKEC